MFDGGGDKAPSQPTIIYASSTKPSATGSGQGSKSGGSGRAPSVAKRKAKKQATTSAAKDKSGTQLVTNDAAGFGLNRPYLAWNVYKTVEETSPTATTTSGTFTSLLTCAIEPQHPRIRVRWRAVTGAGTSGEVRLVDRATGSVLAGPVVIGVASTVEQALDGTLIAPTLSGVGAPYKVDVQGRVTGGANSIGLLVIYACGIGS